MPPTPPEPIPSRFHDPRMRGFRNRSAVEDVHALIDARVGSLGNEAVPLRETAGRVLAVDLRATHAMPPFDRAAMDGYALQGEETFGADPYNPATFRVVGRSRPGQPYPGSLSPGTAVEIATGAPLPAGADAVARVEATQRVGEILQVHEPTPPGRHVGRCGEDMVASSPLLPRGRVLRPQDLGVLSAQAIASVPVFQRPRVTILITGDELLPPGSPPDPDGARIADMNSPMLEALVHRDGGRATLNGPLPDDRDLLRETITRAARDADALLISGGSSTGPEDHAPSLIAELGELPVHGVALRPASPTGLGFLGDLPVLLLPGNPVSCLCAYDFFAGRVLRRLGGRPPDWPYRSLIRPLIEKLSSVLGRLDYARVRLNDHGALPLAISGASILSSTTRADGFVVVPAGLEGYAAGSEVLVWLYDLEDHPQMTPIGTD